MSTETVKTIGDEEPWTFTLNFSERMYIILMEFMYLVFTYLPSESYCKQHSLCLLPFFVLFFCFFEQVQIKYTKKRDKQHGQISHTEQATQHQKYTYTLNDIYTLHFRHKPETIFFQDWTKSFHLETGQCKNYCHDLFLSFILATVSQKMGPLFWASVLKESDAFLQQRRDIHRHCC